MPLRAWSSADYDVPLPEGHRFPARKYRMIREAVVARGILAPDEGLTPDLLEVKMRSGTTRRGVAAVSGGGA